MPKISVIMPVYNVAAYLPKCLDSLINQTFGDLEIICVDDCSPDNSLQVLQQYAEKDERIKIISFNENQGVAVARNRAMEEAQGEYISFIDSDDWIDWDFYEKLYSCAQNTGAELVVGNAKEISAETNKEEKNPWVTQFINNVQKNKLYFNGLFVLGLYKASLLKEHNIVFTEGLIYGEDRMLPLQASYYSKKLVCDPSVYYYYYRRQNSATMRGISEKVIEDFFKSVNMVFDFLDSIELSKEDYCCVVKVFLSHSIQMYYQMSDEKYEKFQPYLVDLCRKVRYQDVFVPADMSDFCELSLAMLQTILKHPKTFDGRKNFNLNVLRALRERHLIRNKKQ
jgi:glycosyltransferase involved in cell wall biosynthesis